MKKLILAFTLFAYSTVAIGMENESPGQTDSDQTEKIEPQSQGESYEDAWTSRSWWTHILNGWDIATAGRNLIRHLREPYTYKANGYTPIKDFIQADEPREIAQAMKNVYAKMTPPLNCYVKMDSSLEGPAFAAHKTISINPRLLMLFNEKERELVVGHEFRHIYNHDSVVGDLWRMTCPVISYGILQAYYKGSNYLLNALQRRTAKKTPLYDWISHLKVINAAVAHNCITNFVLTMYLERKFINFKELRADRESALLLSNVPAAISALKNMQDSNFLERFAGIIGASAETIAASEAVSPYPLVERIPVLEKLINK